VTPPTSVAATDTPRPPKTPGTPPDSCTPGLIVRKFHDLDGDGQRQPGEPMLEGISFDITEVGSDRTHNVTTGADGAVHMRFQGDTVVRIRELTRISGMWAPPDALSQDVRLGCETAEVWVPNAPVAPPNSGGGSPTTSWIERFLGVWPDWVRQLLSQV
jgi:hypothetical protein